MKRLITTVGGAYSNSYVTIPQADLIAFNFPWSSDWNTFSDDDKTLALIQAAFGMQQLPWNGLKCTPASDAGLPQLDWDNYWLKVGSINGEGIFGYLTDDGFAKGSGQGDEVLKYGIDGDILFSATSSFRAKTFETALTFWDKDGTTIAPDRSEIVSSSGSSGDQTRDVIYYWDTPVDISYITGSFNDAFKPSASGTWYWGVYVNGEQLLNFPGTTATQAQRLAWPRSGVTCDGEIADCSYVPETIFITQVMIAYNFLKYPNQVPGTPSEDTTPTGTYIKRQKLDVLEIEYDEFSNAESISCDSCDDPYLLQVYPWLKDILQCWLDISSGNSKMIRLYRN
jgi:hypothetical protein